MSVHKSSKSINTIKKRVFKIIPGERFTPFSLAKKLHAKALLESASFIRGRERFSILLIKKAFSIYQTKDKIYLEKNNRKYLLKSKGKDILDILLYFADQHSDFNFDARSGFDAGSGSGSGPGSGSGSGSGSAAGSGSGSGYGSAFATDFAYNFPFPAGGIGYISYEYAVNFDTINLLKNKPDPLNIPEAHFLIGHIFLIFDHYTDTAMIVGLNYKEHEIDLEKAIRETEEKINDLNFNFMSLSSDKFETKIFSNTNINTNANTDTNTNTNINNGEKQAYLKGVEQVRKEIIKGNLIQGVLSRRVYLKTDIPAFEAYKNLRSFNPSPYMFYLDFDDFKLFGASPEVHVKVKGKKAILRPIAGTRKRGINQEEDSMLEKELLADEKELAEHLMLIDLARNDLGRICQPGSVKVTEKMVIEKYSHVMHIASQVEGNLMKGKNGIDAIRATFPAGTVSGAPKIRAMEIIDSLEEKSRTFYAGIVGYLEPGGSLDTCITIRSAFKKDQLLILQAGAGIVFDSIPEKEYDETSAKLGALCKAIGVEM